MAISILNDLLLFSCLAALHFANLLGQVRMVLTKTVSAIHHRQESRRRRAMSLRVSRALSRKCRWNTEEQLHAG